MIRGTEQEANLGCPNRDNVPIAKNGLSNDLAINGGNGIGLDGNNAASIAIQNDAKVLLPNPLLFNPALSGRRTANHERKMAGIALRARHSAIKKSKLNHLEPFFVDDDLVVWKHFRIFAGVLDRLVPIHI